MKHESLTCKIRKKRPRKFRQLLNVTAPGTGREGNRSQVFPIAHGVWCSFSTPTASLCGPSLNTSGSSFLGTLQNHLEKECSRVEFDTDLALEGKRQKAWVKGTNPFPKWSSESAQLPANWSHTVTYFRPWRCPMIQTSIRILFWEWPPLVVDRVCSKYRCITPAAGMDTVPTTWLQGLGWESECQPCLLVLLEAVP